MLAGNGLRIGEGAEKESTNFQFCTNVSKTIFLFANLHFSKQIKNGFCGIEVQKLNLALNPLFCQYDVVRSPFFFSFRLSVSIGKAEALLQFWLCVVGLCELQMCLRLCGDFTHHHIVMSNVVSQYEYVFKNFFICFNSSVLKFNKQVVIYTVRTVIYPRN